MAELPEQDLTVAAIYRSYEEREAAQKRRPYLGGSQLGEDCRRMLWYSFRWVRRPKFKGRILRLFDTGHREELRIIDDLRRVGCDVLALNPETNEQWEIVACDGHLKGHADGAVLGLLESPATWHLLEAKTMNKKYFDQLLLHGVKKSKPVHWSQCQLYMGGLGLKRAVYVAQCKDDDRLYFERIKYDAKAYKALLLKANTIIKAETPPTRIAKDRSFYKCKFCDYADFCWGTEWPDADNCRTCAHSAPVADGKWECAREFEYGSACDEHIFLPTMIHWAEPIGGDPTHVLYHAEGFGKFVNCAATGWPSEPVDCYSSKELRGE